MTQQGYGSKNRLPTYASSSASSDYTIVQPTFSISNDSRPSETTVTSVSKKSVPQKQEQRIEKRANEQERDLPRMQVNQQAEKPPAPPMKPKYRKIEDTKEETEPIRTKYGAQEVQSTKFEEQKPAVSYTGSYAQQAKQKKSDYTPYTVEDYRCIKDERYVQLGGLGAGHVGTEEWNDKKELADRRKSYAKQANMLNKQKNRIRTTSMQSEVTAKSEPAADARSRAKEYAKQISKPKVKPKKENTPSKVEEKPASRVDELISQHDDYVNMVAQIRKNFNV